MPIDVCSFFSDTYQIVYSNTVPALHDGQEGDEAWNDPASSQHECNSQGGHFVPIHQGLAAYGIVSERERCHVRVLQSVAECSRVRQSAQCLRLRPG